MLPLLGMLLTVATATPTQVAPQPDPWAFDPTDTFNEPHSPLLDGYTIWFMRQNLATDGLQATFNVESGVGASRSLNTNLTTYVPLYMGEKHELMLGARYALAEALTSELPAADHNNHTLWLWGAWGFRPTPAWKLVLTTEFFESGSVSSFPGRTGNEVFPLAYVGYAFSPQWQLVAVGGVSFLWRDHDTKVSPIAGGQLRWIPFHGLRLMVGMPDLFAVEWSVVPWLELAGHVWFEGDADALVRVRALEDLSATVQFERTGARGGEGVFARHAGPEAAEGVEFNSVTQDRNRVFLELAWRLEKTTAISCRFGRTFAEDAELRLDDETVGSVAGRDEWFVGLGVSLLQLGSNLR